MSNEKGRTNVLDRYLNDEITITLPDKKRIADLKWFAIYDLSLHDTFGDIYIPEDFESPDVQVWSSSFQYNVFFYYCKLTHGLSKKSSKTFLK